MQQMPAVQRCARNNHGAHGVLHRHRHGGQQADPDAVLQAHPQLGGGAGGRPPREGLNEVGQRREQRADLEGGAVGAGFEDGV